VNGYETSDWKRYDLLAIERDARAMRDAHVADLCRRAWKRIKAELARAGAQPSKPQRADAANA